MKRQKKTVEKRTYALKNAFPRFVSIVTRGANLTPFSELRFSDDNVKYSDTEINQIVFSKAQFKTVDDVKAYLEKNDFADFEIKDEADTFFVPGLESDKFVDIQTVEYDDGVVYSVGKLKEPVEDAQPAAEVVESHVLASEPEEVKEEVQEQENGEVQEQVTESDEEGPSGEEGQSNSVDESTEATGEEVVAEQEPIEEVVSESEVTPEVVAEVDPKQEQREKAMKFFSTEKFSGPVDYCSFRSQMDDMIEDGSIISYDTAAYSFLSACYCAVSEGAMDEFRKNCNDFYSFVVALQNATKNLSYSEEQVVSDEEPANVTELKAKLAELEQKIEEFSQSSNITIDEEPIIIQNKQSILQDDLTAEEPEVKKDPEVERFRERQKRNLFGI